MKVRVQQLKERVPDAPPMIRPHKPEKTKQNRILTVLRHWFAENVSQSSVRCIHVEHSLPVKALNLLLRIVLLDVNGDSHYFCLLCQDFNLVQAAVNWSCASIKSISKNCFLSTMCMTRGCRTYTPEPRDHIKNHQDWRWSKSWAFFQAAFPVTNNSSARNPVNQPRPLNCAVKQQKKGFSKTEPIHIVR